MLAASLVFIVKEH